MARIGQGLREHYEVSKELPPELLTLVTKFDDSDWLLPSLSWSNDRGLEVEMKVVRGSSPDGYVVKGQTATRKSSLALGRAGH